MYTGVRFWKKAGRNDQSGWYKQNQQKNGENKR